MEKNVNINTILLTILLALGGWTLNRVSNLSEQVAVATERNASMTATMLELRSRLATAEAQIQFNQVEIVKLRKQL